MTFFLVSGYIVPASLERRGDVREFWTGRLFRLYPACLLVYVAALAVLGPTHGGGIGSAVYSVPLLSSLGNATMLEDLLGSYNALSVMWTLTYEMIFYYLVTALFVCGRERRSAPIAGGLGVAALVLGPVMPASLLIRRLGPMPLTLVAVAVLVVGLGGLLSGRRLGTRVGALLLGAFALVLVFLNTRSTGWETLLILATMFSGTAIRRAEQGQITRRSAWVACATVLVCGVVVAAVHNRGASTAMTWTLGPLSWCLPFVAAWLTFGLGMLLRARRMPAPLTWLGRVSYSTYLLHVPLISVMWLLFRVVPQPHGMRHELPWVAGYLVVLFGLSQLTHRCVEVPMQDLGRRIARRLRQDPDAVPAATPGERLPQSPVPVLRR
jgi:peptidoglycan/LPS O-acetylase OafA/YrhL